MPLRTFRACTATIAAPLQLSRFTAGALMFWAIRRRKGPPRSRSCAKWSVAHRRIEGVAQ